MSQKRRDRKNRVLEKGVYQKPTGAYLYKYIDNNGEPQSVTSWRLEKTDPIPSGKRNVEPLRDMIKKIQRDLADGIDPVGRKMTVCQLYEKHTRLNGNVQLGTVEGREQLLNILKHDKLGGYTIERVRPSDAKEWVLRMKEKGYAYQTINNHKRSLSAAFHTAVQDDYIRKNPFGFKTDDVIEDDTKPKIPLTPRQEKSLLAFVQRDKVYCKYYDEVVILLGTGLRISELCGLTMNDLDFVNRTISINHQLLKNKEKGRYIAPPKTENSYRKIPMTDAVYQAFQRVAKRRKGSKTVVIDGHGNFLFCKSDGTPKVASSYQDTFRRMVEKYNKTEREPLPEVMTPHTLRHTFCTNQANAGMNPKALQYIMGHGNITMTLNYYAHSTFEAAKAEFERLLSA